MFMDGQACSVFVCCCCCGKGERKMKQDEKKQYFKKKNGKCSQCGREGEWCSF